MTDKEYEVLQQRVADGKKLLADKWASDDPTIRSWITLWFQLGDQLFAEDIARGNVTSVESQPHSQAWKDMKAREAIDEDKRAVARERAKVRRDEKRRGIT